MSKKSVARRPLPIQFDTCPSTIGIARDYPTLLVTMEAQMREAGAEFLGYVDLDPVVWERLAVAATRVAVEVCPHCRETRLPCNCTRDA